MLIFSSAGGRVYIPRNCRPPEKKKQLAAGAPVIHS